MQVKSSGVLHGTAPYEMEDGQPMAADVDIVVYGVAKVITTLQMSNYIEKKEVKVLNCSKLTTFERARTLSYKVTIKACDYDKSHDPSPSGQTERESEIFKTTEDYNRK